LNFEKIIARYEIFRQRDNNTPEKRIEYETYALLKDLLDLVEGFESGNRIVLKIADHDEILRKLKYWKNQAKRNIDYLQEIRKRKDGGN